MEPELSPIPPTPDTNLKVSRYSVLIPRILETLKVSRYSVLIPRILETLSARHPSAHHPYT
jgi:hypothetical protein